MRRYWEKRTIRRMELRRRHKGETAGRPGWGQETGLRGKEMQGVRGLGLGKDWHWCPLTKLRFPSGSQLGHQQLGRQRGQ